MLSKTAVFLLAVALPAIRGFGLGGNNNMLSSKLSSLINGGNNRPVPTTSTYTLPSPSTSTITISPTVYYTPTYIPTPFPVPVPAPVPAPAPAPVQANDEILPAKEEMADAVDENADGGRRRKRVQRVFSKRNRRVKRRKNRRSG